MHPKSELELRLREHGAFVQKRFYGLELFILTFIAQGKHNALAAAVSAGNASREHL